tara:strand:+ start:228 stop:1142 length:915 start_codon:yes stop_codon:yes gene_type:complete
VIKSKLLTSTFQKYLGTKDIRNFKGKFLYYLIFRLIRNFLASDLILHIYNFKVFGSINRNKTSYFLLKKCEFGDYHELNIIKQLSKKNKILLVDCGCNYGFYSFYTASLNKDNYIIAVEASKKTSYEFLKNLKLNNFSNIVFKNNAVSNIDDINIIFNESENDWESSQSHNNFKSFSITNIKSIKIDTLLENFEYKNYISIIKLDIEGNELNALNGGLSFIERSSPLIIIEFSKYIFDKQDNIEHLKSFLNKYDYSIYNTQKKKINLEEILNKLNNLKKRYKTIGNFYLIKNSSNNLKLFLLND